MFTDVGTLPFLVPSRSKTLRGSDFVTACVILFLSCAARSRLADLLAGGFDVRLITLDGFGTSGVLLYSEFPE